MSVDEDGQPVIINLIVIEELREKFSLTFKLLTGFEFALVVKEHRINLRLRMIFNSI